MQLYVTVFFFLAASWVQQGQAAKCSLDVLDRVLELYQKHKTVPSGIVARNIQLSPDIVVATTDGYFDNQDNILCVSTSWTAGGVFTSTFVSKDIELTTGASQAVTELPGQTYNSETGVRRYHIPTSGLVTAFVACEENGDEDDSPKGLVKVWKGYKPADLKRAIKELEYVLGTSLTQRFADSCEV